MPAYAVYVSIAAMQAVSISLFVFCTRSPVKIFWSKNRLFPLLPRIYAERARQAWGKAFSAQPQPHCHHTCRKQRKRLNTVGKGSRLRCRVSKNYGRRYYSFRLP